MHVRNHNDVKDLRPVIINNSVAVVRSLRRSLHTFKSVPTAVEEKRTVIDERQGRDKSEETYDDKQACTTLQCGGSA